MAYNRNIPQPTDLISNSQPQLLANFQSIDSGSTQTGTGFSRNHVTLTDSTNGGLHNRIDFYENIATPSISGFVASLYPLLVSSASELAYTNAGGTTQITSGSNAIWKGGSGTGLVSVTLAQSGQLNLPNGLQYRWGFVTGLNDGSTVSFTPAFSNACFGVQVTGARNDNSIRSLWVADGPAPTASQFTIHCSASGQAIWYFAVGN